MRPVNELKRILSQHFTFNKSRRECFSLLIIALVKVRTVSLIELAQGFEGKAKLKSKYRRIQRFFDNFDFDMSTVSIFLLKLFGLFDNPIYLAMDRTNWKFGKKNINILLISAVCGTYAVPIYWILLNKRGCSKHTERKNVIDFLLKIINSSTVAGILTDREFIGGKWIKYLSERRLPFFIRLRKNLIIEACNAQFRVDRLFSSIIKKKETKIIKNAKLSGISITLSAAVNDKGELIVIASNTDTENAIEIYLKRWKIETMFGFFKTKGFNFESTHITDMAKISKMIVLISITYSWSIKVGEWKEKIEPVKIKNNGRREISIFRYGLDCVREALLNTNNRIKKKIQFLVKLLTPNNKYAWSQ
jgi:hypothetical protein